MITPLNFPIYRQGNPLWSGQRLGKVNGTTIGSHGCLISCLAMASAAFGEAINPAQVDDRFTDNKGYANGNLVIWNAIQRLLPQVKQVGVVYCDKVAAPINDIRNHINNGGLAALRVGFGGNPANMHWVLADGFDGDDIIKCDPWYGDETGFGSKNAVGRPRYGTGIASRDILEVHYFVDGVVPTPAVAAPVPVAKQPVAIPEEVPAAPVDTVANNQPPVVEPIPEPVVEAPVVPEWEVTFQPDEQMRTIMRSNAVVYDTINEKNVGALELNDTREYVGTFSHKGHAYYMTATSHSLKNGMGVGIEFFTEPSGYAEGTVPVTVTTNEQQGFEAVEVVDVPTSPRVTLWAALKEALAKWLAARTTKKES